MGHLSQSRATSITSHINQETNTSVSVIKEINAFSTLKPEWLPEYYKKNLRKHSNFFHSTDTLFNINTLYFSTERSKIYFIMQYLRGESQNMWYNKLKELKKPELIKKMIFKNFKQFLLDFIENSINHQFHHVQLHQNTKQESQQSIQAFASYLKNLEAHIPLMMKKHCCSTLFTKLQPELRVVFINFQTLPDTFESLVALSARLKQNQWQLPGSAILIKCSWPENGMKRTNTGQQSKKPKNEEVSAFNQHKRWTDDKNKKNVTCYQCNKKGHYKLQYSKVARKQFKNANQAPVRKVCVKGKYQCSQKSLWVQNEEQ